jgi:hypothetical protein
LGDGSSSLQDFIMSGMQAHLENPELGEAVEDVFVLIQFLASVPDPMNTGPGFKT